MKTSLRIVLVSSLYVLCNGVEAEESFFIRFFGNLFSSFTDKETEMSTTMEMWNNEDLNATTAVTAWPWSHQSTNTAKTSKRTTKKNRKTAPVSLKPTKSHLTKNNSISLKPKNNDRPAVIIIDLNSSESKSGLTKTTKQVDFTNSSSTPEVIGAISPAISHILQRNEFSQKKFGYFFLFFLSLLL